MNEVRIDTSGVDRYRRQINDELARPGGGRMRRCFTQWAFRWRSFQKLRFDRYSRGGGDWAPLAPSTKDSRRGPRKGASGARVFTILRDKLGSLLKALTPAFVSAPGQFQEDIPYGITVGFGGPQRHPGGAVTLADIATFHHTGAGNLPERKVIDTPNQTTLNGMKTDLERAVAGLLDDTRIK